MKLDRLRGYGPWFAFGTPVLFFLSVVAVVILTSSVHIHGENQPPTFPDWFPVGVAIWLILLELTMLTALVVAIDLEWIEHPRTHTGLTYVGLGAMTVAALAFLGILIEGVAHPSSGWVSRVTSFLFLAGFGVYLVVMNWVGWRAHLLGQLLPWIGIVTGVLFLLAAISVFVASFLAVALLPAVPLYLAWSLWLGFKLRGQAPPEAAPAA